MMSCIEEHGVSSKLQSEHTSSALPHVSCEGCCMRHAQSLRLQFQQWQYELNEFIFVGQYK